MPTWNAEALAVLNNDLEQSNFKAEPAEILSEVRAAKLPFSEGFAALANPSMAAGTFVALEGEVRDVRSERGRFVVTLDSVRIIKQLINVRTTVVGRSVYTTNEYQEQFIPQGRPFVVEIASPKESLLKEAYWTVAGIVTGGSAAGQREATPVFYRPTSNLTLGTGPALVIEGNAVSRRPKKWTE